MPYTQHISPGVLTQLVQNQVYALPARACVVNCSEDIQLSNDIGFTTSAALVKNTVANVAAAFVRCTGAANAVIICKPY